MIDSLKRYIDRAIRRELSRRLDSEKYYLIKSSTGLAIPEEFRGPFSFSGLQKALKKFEKYAREQGYSGRGRCEYHTVSEYGRSRDFI